MNIQDFTRRMNQLRRVEAPAWWRRAHELVAIFFCVEPNQEKLRDEKEAIHHEVHPRLLAVRSIGITFGTNTQDGAATTGHDVSFRGKRRRGNTRTRGNSRAEAVGC